MNMKNTRKRGAIRGFTLVEMVVVVAIIGILLIAFVPAIAGYWTKSRLSSANSNAKVLFNSTQTICQEYEFADRSATVSEFYDTASSGQLVLYSDPLADDDEKISVSVYGTGISTSFPATLYSAINNISSSASYASRLKRLFDENTDISWCVVIEGYQVRAAFCASNEDSPYIGAFPTRSNERDGSDVLGSETEMSELKDPDARVVNYINSAWNPATPFAFDSLIGTAP